MHCRSMRKPLPIGLIVAGLVAGCARRNEGPNSTTSVDSGDPASAAMQSENPNLSDATAPVEAAASAASTPPRDPKVVHAEEIVFAHGTAALNASQAERLRAIGTGIFLDDPMEQIEFRSRLKEGRYRAVLRVSDRGESTKALSKRRCDAIAKVLNSTNLTITVSLDESTLATKPSGVRVGDVVEFVVLRRDAG